MNRTCPESCRDSSAPAGALAPLDCWACVVRRAQSMDTLRAVGDAVLEEWVRARRWAWERGVVLGESVTD